MTSLRLQLYVTSLDREAEALLAELRRLLAEAPGVDAVIEVVDVIEAPEEALANDVFATPTLLRRLPEPAVKILARLDRVADIALQLEGRGMDELGS